MERLTVPDERISEHVTRISIIDARKVREHAMDFYWRLKEYEDTGLTPEQMKQSFNEDAILQLAAQIAGITPDRLKALLQAEKAFVTISAPGPMEQDEKGE